MDCKSIGSGVRTCRTDMRDGILMPNARQVIADLEVPSADRRPVIRRLVAEAPIAVLLEALDIADNEMTRVLLVDMLGRRRDPASLSSLLGMLTENSVAVRAASADAIGKIFGYVQDPPLHERGRVRAALVDAWDREGAPEVRSTLAQSLALLGDLRILPLLEAAQHDKDPRVRRQAEWGSEYLKRGTSS